jgi:nicotinamidase-related amidase
MRKKIILIIGIFCLGSNICLSQDNKQFHDRYIMVLDVQKQFYENKPFDTSAKTMVNTINLIIDRFDPENVIYIKSAGLALSLTSKGFSVDTIPPPDIDSNLKMVSKHIFTKCDGNAFTTEELNKFLENNKVKEIVLVGLLAEKCIYNTALGGKEKGYNMYLIPEGIIGKTTKKKVKAINKMIKKGIKLLPIKEILRTI